MASVGGVQTGNGKVLPNLPTAQTTLAEHTADNRAIVARALQQSGLLGTQSEAKARKLIDQITLRVANKLDTERTANAGKVDDFMANIIVGKDRFDTQQAKTVRRRWIVGTAGFAAGIVASGAVSIGVSQLFKLMHFSWAGDLNTVFSPAVFLISGTITSCFTYLFLELTTTPLQARFGNFAFKGSPIQSHINAQSGQTFIDAYNAANQIDNRVFTAIATLTSLIFNLELTIGGPRGVNDLIRQARLAGDANTKKALLEEAGEKLGGKLIWCEVGHFQFNPMFEEIFNYVHATCGSPFERMSPEDMETFTQAALDWVKKARPTADGDRPDADKAIETYFKPFLSRLMKGVPGGKLGVTNAA